MASPGLHFRSYSVRSPLTTGPPSARPVLALLSSEGLSRAARDLRRLYYIRMEELERAEPRSATREAKESVQMPRWRRVIR
jgi:hypothetical protein